MSSLLGVRPEDGRVVGLAFATLLLMVAAHSVLETARDALFLAALPAQRLPWAYLGIATLAFLGAWANGRLATAGAPGRVLAMLLVTGGAGTVVFWRVLAVPTSAALMALYIWTGVLASIVVTQFWVQLASRMDVGRARRAYALVGAGGMTGATLGSLLASVVLTGHEPRALLPIAAALFVTAALLPAFAADDHDTRDAPEPASDDDTQPTLRAVWNDPYMKRLVPLAALAPIVAMGVDFIFKSVVTHAVPRTELGSFFARYNAIVNALALIFQLTVAPRLLQGIGVVKSLCLLPGALGAVAAGVAGTAALPAALVLRGTDGVLRHSLHRAATEILFVPLSGSTRAALRGLTESLGQRGGQVLGSLLILAAITLGATPPGIAAAVAVLCALWLLGYVRLERHYVERFRTQLRAFSTTSDTTVPALDLKSLETLVATLSSPNDAEVLAAMDVLASVGRARLVPPLILYHPSDAVVLRALALFDDVTRDDVQEIRRRLLAHDLPAVRAAALRSLAATGKDHAVVRLMLREDTSPLVRATALVLWTGAKDTPAADLDDAVRDLLASPDPVSRLAVAAAFGELPSRLRLPVAQALLHDATPTIRREVARTLAADPDVALMALLTELVAMPECRVAARAGLLTLGDPALEHLGRVLADPATPNALRRHLPRTISPFASARAAEMLVTQLGHEDDGRVIYKLLRGLGRMRTDDPSLPVDRATLVGQAERTLERTVALLAYRVAHEMLTAEGEDLLGVLLAEKEQRAIERVFRILQIVETSEDFATMHAALSSDVPATRAGARELIGHVLDGRFRDALLALTDSLPPAERLQEAASALSVPVADTALVAWRTPSTDASVDALATVVATMCDDLSLAVAALARRQLSANLKETPRAAI
ncbi:MAG TPA: Npt1/Npt2 family nucleotide transporter [Candidatus Binatia bacterium]|jgi:hypothetical protein|nr:Npt1/Npt2 family nucleotide transporter [Candidatus Binatia bacterium]